MKRVFLIGYMGSGKTTVGKKLASLLKLSFIDLDAYIEGKHRKKISEIFAEKGEDEFRKIERRALIDVSQIENAIISTGGGAPCFFDNMSLMNESGVTVYIEADPEELAARLMASKTVRPLIAGKSKDELIPFITKHLADRERYYRNAKIIYHTERMISKEDVYLTVNGIAEQLNKYLPESFQK
ncbi:MAG TPA: shikimate kinase [Fermentimonas caenicola]|jgi:shikimate kinase|nr:MULTISPECIES: shikimate kinase [Lascolabacillus]MBP6174841.1 shikimate kinase [Fermentimonas sp.]TAH61078.1 MAG: shikimate kinase [Fermentimonas caenicola]MBP7104135.1 shikimate kinase [Fermentimonas sp.]MCK9501606.1 shikimate kinase [Lascolabacillus sp.]MDD2607272.1 shikimate kinase [Lascolabacillus sp.]